MVHEMVRDLSRGACGSSDMRSASSAEHVTWCRVALVDSSTLILGISKSFKSRNVKTHAEYNGIPSSRKVKFGHDHMSGRVTLSD